MSKVKISMSLLLTALVVVSVLAMGCPPPRVVEPPVEEPPVVVEPPVRMGAWLDEIVAIIMDHDLAIPKIAAGELHLFGDDIADPEFFEKVVAHPEMGYEQLFGVFMELTLNPAGTPEDPTFRDGRLNPFAVPRIREAMNWLLDRDYIAEEIWKGMAIPRYFPLHPAFPDYARIIDVARALELRYAYDPDKGRAIILEEMEKLGAELIDGIWHWEIEGVMEPVEIIVLGRIEDARRELAHHVTRILEDLGFVVKELIKTSADASPIWLHGHPYDGLMHIYTGGWIATVISRDQRGVFDYFYTERGIPLPLWRYTKPTPEFDELAERLDLADYECLEERAAMMGRALELAMEDSHRIFVANSVGFMPRRAEIVLASCLAGGIGGGWLWGLTIRFECPVTGEIQPGGSATVAMPDLMTDPWNPVAGSNWLFDWMFKRAMSDWGAAPDPFTGLWHPQRLERAEVYVREGLPVGVTLDWVDLQFVPAAMEVPADAWVDWCAVEERFITKAEAAAKEGWDPERATADARIRVHYPADLFDKVKWHDGSPLDMGDFLMQMIVDFDRAKEESPIFDPAWVPIYTTFMDHFRGVRIVSEDPLIIESYTTMTALDAEVMAAGWTWWPEYFRGPGAWHNVALGVLAETAEEIAFGSAKAADLGVDWMSFIAGPSLPILERHLGEAKAAGWIPYAPTLGEFITPAEAAARYANLQNWFEERGHFWLATGPFYLHAAFPVEEILHLKRFPYFPDPADKWVGFVEPRIAEVEVIGPTVVTAGDEAAFDIEVTFEGEPYPVADVDFVTYLLVDATGEIVHVGEAVAVRDGLWQVVLPGALTAELVAGSTSLEVVVAPIVVAIPTFDAAMFVLLP
ncbi:ABC transporter substrate-binding protein [Dehalococcoidia bacterium]|nr:ABC transporter substrate-binding protein [Dehalococcoidia bacterium]